MSLSILLFFLPVSLYLKQVFVYNIQLGLALFLNTILESLPFNWVFRPFTLNMTIYMFGFKSSIFLPALYFICSSFLFPVFCWLEYFYDSILSPLLTYQLYPFVLLLYFFFLQYTVYNIIIYLKTILYCLKYNVRSLQLYTSSFCLLLLCYHYTFYPTYVINFKKYLGFKQSIHFFKVYLKFFIQ